MTSDINLELLQAVNPVPQPDHLADSLGIADNALLLLIEERSVAMSTSTERESTKGIPNLADEAEPGRPVAGPAGKGWRYALGAFVIVLIAGVAAAWLAVSGSPAPVAATSIDLVGGEVTKNFDNQLGFTYAGEDLATLSSPGPSLEIELGSEVTLTFTNRGGWSGTADEAIPHSFRALPTIPSPETLWAGADTGLVEPGESATITFTPTEVGEYRYVSDGLGAVGRGMFGRIIVTQPTDADSTDVDIVGTWSIGNGEFVFSEDATFVFTGPTGTAEGTYLVRIEDSGPRVVLDTETSTVPNAEFGEPCTGGDFYLATFNDDGTVTLSYGDGNCDLSWPSFVTLTPIP